MAALIGQLPDLLTDSSRLFCGQTGGGSAGGGHDPEGLGGRFLHALNLHRAMPHAMGSSTYS